MRKLTWMLGVAACALSLAACGSASKPSSASTTGDPGLELARCMRANGVPNFPDPSSGSGGGVQFNVQINPQTPGVKGALKACSKYLPNKPNPGAMSASQRARAVAFARCMRDHGISDFPDPILGSPSPTVNERVLALQGMFFVVGPGLDPRSPAFRQGAGECGVKVPPLGGGQVRIGG